MVEPLRVDRERERPELVRAGWSGSAGVSFWICAATASASTPRDRELGLEQPQERDDQHAELVGRQPRRDRERGLRELERGAGREPDRVAARAARSTLPITSETGLVGSATITHGWRFET